MYSTVYIYIKIGILKIINSRDVASSCSDCGLQYFCSRLGECVSCSLCAAPQACDRCPSIPSSDVATTGTPWSGSTTLTTTTSSTREPFFVPIMVCAVILSLALVLIIGIMYVRRKAAKHRQPPRYEVRYERTTANHEEAVMV